MTSMDSLRICTSCNATLSLDNFRKRSMNRGLERVCKTCWRERERARMQIKVTSGYTRVDNKKRACRTRIDEIKLALGVRIADSIRILPLWILITYQVSRSLKLLPHWWALVNSSWLWLRLKSVKLSVQIVTEFARHSENSMLENHKNQQILECSKEQSDCTSLHVKIAN
jgi:hypothetical protein